MLYFHFSLAQIGHKFVTTLKANVDVYVFYCYNIFWQTFSSLWWVWLLLLLLHILMNCWFSLCSLTLNWWPVMDCRGRSTTEGQHTTQTDKLTDHWGGMCLFLLCFHLADLILQTEMAFRDKQSFQNRSCSSVWYYFHRFLQW